MKMEGDIIAEKGYLKTQIEKWEEIVDNIDSAVRNVNDETKVIKYNDVPSNIYLAVEGIADTLGQKLSLEKSQELKKELEWKIDEVREAVNNLESAMYNLVEPFEDMKRDAENKKDDFEYELDDLEWEEEKLQKAS
ncbi:MAG: hypothetical protein CL756_04265 [Chloroflexi bacterium]|nr:hypothetical protein [Chloroflexota bacterium]